MKKTCTIILLFFTIQAKYASSASGQTLPALLAAGDKTAFSYMECYPNVPDKKMRHCSRFDFTFRVQNDTLYFSQIAYEKAELPDKIEISYTTNYSVALPDIFYEMTLDKLQDKMVSRLSDMQGTLGYFYQFTLYTQGIMKESQSGSKYKMDVIDLYSAGKNDAEEFLKYLQELHAK